MSELQRTEEWHQARLGKATASRIADVVAKTKTGWGASRANYRAELVIERLTGVRADSYQSSAMQWGTEHEAEAIALYSFERDAEVTGVGFLDHPTIAMSGASPDGLVGSDGLIEVKCPNSATHIDTLLAGTVDGKYRLQMQWQMDVTGRRWCDFVSYDPRLPGNLQLFVTRIERDDKAIAELRQQVAEFLGEVDAMVESLKRKCA